MTKFARPFLVAATVALLLGFATPPAQAAEGDWMFRVRFIGILPDDAGTDQLDGVGVDEDFTFEVDITRFFTEHLALEVVAATASQPITGDGNSLGSVSLLPPTFTLQWHFMPEGGFKPYVGGGVNYTIFYNQTGFVDNLDLENSFGLAGGLGADIMMGETIFLNIDLKYVNIETDVEVDSTDMGSIEINPWVFGIGFGHSW